MISAHLQLLTPANTLKAEVEPADAQAVAHGPDGRAIEIGVEGLDFGSLVATALSSSEAPPTKGEISVDVVDAVEVEKASWDKSSGTDLPTRGKDAPQSETPVPALSALPKNEHAVEKPIPSLDNEDRAPELAIRSDTQVQPERWSDTRVRESGQKTDESLRLSLSAQVPPGHAPRGQSREGLATEELEHADTPDAAQKSDGGGRASQGYEKAVKLAASDPPVPAELRQIPTETAPAAGSPIPPKHLRADAPVPVPDRTLPVVGFAKQSLKDSQPTAKVPPAPSPEKAGPRLVGQSSEPGGKALSLAGSSAAPPQASDAGAALQTTAPQPANSIAANALTTANPVTPTPEIRSEARVIPQIEQAIDALTDAREAGRASRPEVLLRHNEFGLVSMRLEAASGDLRATLASRDPGFIPAVQAALGERAVAASSETAANHNQQRGQELGSGTFTGANSGFSANYGSSPGSSQGSSQPRLPQQELTQQDADFGDGNEAGDGPPTGTDTGGLFA